MKALTLWQPWASLIALGAKPYEFRRYDYRKRIGGLVGTRIAIHAGARPERLGEIFDIIARLNRNESALVEAIARPILEKAVNVRKAWSSHSPRAHIFPLSTVLCTAIIGEPVLASELFKDAVADSTRFVESIWAWPLTEVVAFDEPVPYQGHQSFWTFPDGLVPK